MILRILEKIFAKPKPQVYIHIGPGKTGTSVIQNWCASNRELLINNGIYYPEHFVDANGVSSGHQKHFLKPEESDKWHFCPTRATRAKREILNSSAKKVILSCERFNAHIDNLVVLFPDAKFIYYLRSPLDVLESGYNQSVKRSGMKKPLSPDLSKFSGFPIGVSRLLNAIEKHGRERFIIRLYDKAQFKNSNILFDFLDLFSLEPGDEFSNIEINTSYSFQSLEFKRMCNRKNFERDVLVRLDKILQGYDEGFYKYSLLSKSFFEKAKLKTVKEMERLIQELGITGEKSDRFLNNLSKTVQKCRLKQRLSQEQIQKILEYIDSQDRELANFLRESIGNK